MPYRSADSSGWFADALQALSVLHQHAANLTPHQASQAGELIRELERSLDRHHKRTREPGEQERSEEHFRLALDHYPGSLVIYDVEGRIQYVNRRAADFGGWQPDEMVGYPATHFMSPQLADQVLPLYDKAVATGQIHSGEAIVELPSGTHTIIITCVPIHDEQSGQVRQVLGITHDVTERQQSRHTLQNSLTLAESIISAAHEALLVLTDDLHVQQANAAFYDLLKLSPAEVERQPLFELGDSAWDIPELRASLERLRANGTELRNLEITHAFPQVGLLTLQLNARPLPPYNGGKLLLVAINNITEVKQAENRLVRYSEELARSNYDLEQFAYVASHDLQEPLRIIVSYLNLLQQRYSGRLEADADEFIGYAVDGAQRLQALIGDLLAYARIDHEGQQFEPVDLHRVLERVLANLDSRIRESGASITSSRLPTLLADEQQMVQLFQNLIDNAIKFRRDEPPRIHIQAEQNYEGWLFAVQDNGIGVSAEDALKLFALFARLHSRVNYPGTGLGLAICRKVVERHGGHIWLEPQGEHGTIFYFTLPTEMKRANTYGQKQGA
ncbi:MAG: PAS domain-containing protein [Chloroflexi bacterium]|nr:PAS domain-containing protein [Chloroflexota bacterium]